MKYNSDEQKIINEWLTYVGAPYLVDEEFFEYKDGQLLEIAKAKEDSLLTWDDSQHLQTMMDMEIPLKMSIRFVGILWENNIEVLEMNTDKSKEYKDKWILIEVENQNINEPDTYNSYMEAYNEMKSRYEHLVEEGNEASISEYDASIQTDSYNIDWKIYEVKA